MRPSRRFREQEVAFRTQYAELKERTLAAGRLLPGTPGSLVLREGSGYPHWYRVYYSVPGKQSEEHVCRDGDRKSLDDMRERIELSEWTSKQVSALRKLGYQVADKSVARVLVELHARGAFEAGLVLVGTLSYMAWLNELGAIAVSARTMDIDLARGRRLDLAAPMSLLSTLQATGMRFSAVPGFSARHGPTSAKLPGSQGLRVDVLAPGPRLGAVVDAPELAWAAQAVPHYDYLLQEPEPGAMLAGGHCVPLRLPCAPRVVWHKLYASTRRRGFREKAVKDQQQALVLASVLAEHEPSTLREAFEDAPKSMLASIRPLCTGWVEQLAAHEPLVEVLRACLARRR